jgi:aminoglycoside 3-N-acetyltransferase
MKPHTVTELTRQLRDLGLQAGDDVMVHSSFKSLGIRHPEEIVLALLAALGDTGTLLVPALTYMQEPRTFHDTRSTPTCVGYLTEYFRKRPGTRRSLHPTHSVCAVGARVDDYLGDHIEDDSPCGPHSPFHKLLFRGGKVLMLGCGLRPNTAMHAIEELVGPPYYFGDPKVYTIVDAWGQTFKKRYRAHGFRNYRQRYERVADLMEPPALRTGVVEQAACHLVEAGALKDCVVAKLNEEPFYFVDRFITMGF